MAHAIAQPQILNATVISVLKQRVAEVPLHQIPRRSMLEPHLVQMCEIRCRRPTLVREATPFSGLD